MKIAIVGAGAAGCFCAVNLKRMLPEAHVDVFESGRKPLAKVAVTGGGRCNLTNSFAAVRSLQQVYPRGHQLMKRLFHQFDHNALMQWFEAEGVRLTIQDDQCVFPVSQDAMQIVSTLTRQMERQGVMLRCGCHVDAIYPDKTIAYHAESKTDPHVTSAYDAIVITTGGAPKVSGLEFLAPLELEQAPPVPSLFSFDLEKDDPPLQNLMGVVIEQTSVTLAGTKLRTEGPLLITHWGVSGPAILRLSSYAAQQLAEQNYQAMLLINWVGNANEDSLRDLLRQQFGNAPQKQIGNLNLLTSRLWHHLLQKAGIPQERRCAEVGSKQLNRLIAILTADPYQIRGKGQFKEEFVTCGGVTLSNITQHTLECRKHTGFYFAGEVLDVDAVTGGFNLQAAWTMGWTVAHSIAAIGQNAK